MVMVRTTSPYFRQTAPWRFGTACWRDLLNEVTVYRPQRPRSPASRRARLLRRQRFGVVEVKTEMVRCNQRASLDGFLATT